MTEVLEFGWSDGGAADLSQVVLAPNSFDRFNWIVRLGNSYISFFFYNINNKILILS